MKRDTNRSAKLIRNSTNAARRAASNRAARCGRPRLSFEPLEDRTVLSAPGDIEWLRQFGSVLEGTSDLGRAVDENGNVYIAGRASGALAGQTSAGGDDAFVSKYDADGNLQWVRQFGTTSNDQGNGVVVNASGVYVAGFTFSTLPGQASTGGKDAFVRKYDTAGNELWTRQFGTAGEDEASGIAADDAGIYVVGLVSGALPGQTYAGLRDSFVRKYDSSGSELWTRQFNTGNLEQTTSVAVGDSSVFVAGTTDSLGDVFLHKYDTAGNQLWSRQFGSSQHDIPNSIATDTTGVYVVGSTSGVLPGQVGQNFQADSFVRKYDAGGIELWTRQFSSFTNTARVNDSAFGVAADSSGIYVAGLTNGALPGQTLLGGPDAYLRKYDPAGTEIWTRQFGTVGNDSAAGVAAGASGIYLVGQTSGAFPGHTNKVGNDVFLGKFDTGGELLWIRQFGSFAAQQDNARAVDADGNVYVTGSVRGVLPGQVSVGNLDAFVRKYDALGNELWTRQFGALGDDQATAIAVDASGVYVVGSTVDDAFLTMFNLAGSLIFTRQFGTSGVDGATGVAAGGSLGILVTGFTSGAFPGHTSAGGVDVFVRSYNLGGNLQSFATNGTAQFGTAGTDQPAGIAVGGLGPGLGIYVTGMTTGTFAGQTSSGGQDAFVQKLSALGLNVWTRQFGTTALDSATGIAADTSGDAYVSGFTAGTVVGQPGAGGDDAFLRRYNADGTVQWTRQFGTADADRANGVALGDTSAYVAGHTMGTLPDQSSAGGQDAFVQKYDLSGGALWTRQFGTPADDSAAGISVSDSGLYVAGFTTGTFPGQTSSGLTDAFVAKIVDAAANTPPSNVTLNLNASVDENGTATLNGSFTDPDAADTHTVVIDWGDGETTTVTLAAGVTTFTTTHTYLDDAPPGTDSDVYTVDATVTEPAGGSANTSTNITVHNVAPTAVDDSAVTNEDQAVTIDVLANDSDIAGALDPLEILSVTNGLKGTVSIDTKGTADSTDDEIVYTPDLGETGSDSFTYTISDGDAGTATATVNVQIRNLVDLSGRVFDDKDNDGVYEPADGDGGIGGVSVQLIDESSAALIATQSTAADGTYSFDANLDAGTYKIVAGQPLGFLDGRETAGNIGGPVDNSQDSNQITGINVGAPGTTLDAIDYLFAEILPSQALGLVWLDADNDGEVDIDEEVIANAIIELTGVDDRGQTVSRSATTDSNGVYAFQDLRPSNAAGYTIREIQPEAFVDGLDVLGTVNGVAVGVNSANDTFSGVVLPRPNSLAENYNFGEQRPAEGGVEHGQTATIGFWQNKNGQKLIKSLNGGSTSTQLGNWLATTFPNMYGALAGANNLAGKTNAQIAAFYKTLFARTRCGAAGGGPPKMDAQVMATALAVYVTNQSLAGTTAASYGFLITATGVGARTFNVGSNGAAFGVANNSSVRVLDLLLAVNTRSRNGLLYDLDGDGDANDSLETTYRTMANIVFTGINEAGDI